MREAIYKDSNENAPVIGTAATIINESLNVLNCNRFSSGNVSRVPLTEIAEYYDSYSPAIDRKLFIRLVRFADSLECHLIEQSDAERREKEAKEAKAKAAKKGR